MTRLLQNSNNDTVMSKLEELIQKYCPDGVECVKIQDVCGVFTGGEIPEGSIKGCTPQGDMVYPIWGNGKEVYGYAKTYKISQDAVCVSSIGANTGDVFFHKAFFTPIIRLKVLIPQDDRLSVKFLYYALSSIDFEVKKSSVPNMNANEVKQKRIPLPPLPVQEEIVRILDTLSELQRELQRELQAEQQNRMKQYKFYRDSLLSPPSDALTSAGWKEYALGQLCSYSKERIGVEMINADNYVSVENLLPNQQGKVKASSIPKDGNCVRYEPDNVLIGNIRPYLKKIWLADCIGGTNGDVLCIRVKEEAQRIISSQFLFYVLSSQSFFDYDNSHAKGAKMPRGDKLKVMQYKFFVPSLIEQERIVSILGRFDTLANEHLTTLPVEIEKRRQQYEYYRDKLLTFKRKEA